MWKSDVGITEEKSQECTKGPGVNSRERANKMRKAEKYVVFFELATVLLERTFARHESSQVYYPDM